MQSDIPFTRDLVLIGGGHAHALAARMWGMKPVAGVRVTVINPGPTAPYSGMLPGHIAGHYTREDLDIDLVALCRFAGARLILGHASMIDPVAKTVTVDTGAGLREISYDVASIDVGIHAEMPAIDGFAEHALGAKPLDTYAAGWRNFLDRAGRGEVPPEVAVIGGGVAGTELAMAMRHALGRAVGQAKVTLIEAGDTLSGFTPRALARVDAALAELGVTTRTGARVARVESGAVVLGDDSRIPAALTVGAAGAFAHGWLAKTPLPITEDGYIRVDATLAVEGCADLYAVGDCAHFTPSPLAKAGVYAVREAPILAHNLIARLTGGATKPYKPQRDFLKLVSLGGKSALAEKVGFAVSGPLLWRWKNRIDQKFMDMFRHLPEMPAAKLPDRLAMGVRAELGSEDQMLCAGCGSKVAPGVLTTAIAGGTTRADVLNGPGDDAAVLDIGGQRQVLTTDHLRAFTQDPALLARVTALHALGDIWAMGAEPQAALAQIILPRMSEDLQARTMSEIMQAARAVFDEAGAVIAGGHTTMGAEMTIGFTITGLADNPITLDGARPGDALILTRPIGSGTLLAAEMRGKADGRQVAAMFDQMTRSQGRVAKALASAHAMTDVTGFGLAGHAMGIARASGVDVVLTLDAVPTYAGALDLAAKGIRSTLYPGNLAAAPVEGHGDAARMALLHDPQTAGGLLAAVAPADLDRITADIEAAGGTAHVIGHCEEGEGRVRVA